MPHVTEIKVRGYHLDLYGHVNNARYLEFLEEARWGVFEETGNLDAFVSHGFGFSVVNININYRRPAFMGEVLEIETSLASLGNRSGKIHQAVRLKGSATPVADADVTFVVVDAQEGKALPMEGELRDLLQGMA
ncbi:MAG: acyl-CoA thioesterase [Deltaproteobacteria bacterium]|nr:acyl-CoA thioesterase [Deltaproteobacteria bacterium]